ncbi:MAG: hypothetical protein Q9191_006390 [Dirinaria sp. TL-2023a]
MMFRSDNGGLDAILKRPEKKPNPTFWQGFFSSPWRHLADLLYEKRQVEPRYHTHPVSIVCVSDTHNNEPNIPDSDVLVHAGDLTQTGTMEEVQRNLDWLQSLPHPHKIIIAGNHDFALLSEDWRSLRWGDIVYLQEARTKIRFANGRTINFYGELGGTCNHGNLLFKYHPHEDTWNDKNPQEVNVFITHAPPKYHLDVDGYGSDHLLKELWRIRPRLHVFGHVHGGYGKQVMTFDRFEAAYEQIRRGHAGIGALLKMCYYYAAYLLSPAAMKDAIPRTTLVNAAIVGGLRDELRREPIKVFI